MRCSNKSCPKQAYGVLIALGYFILCKQCTCSYDLSEREACWVTIHSELALTTPACSSFEFSDFPLWIAQQVGACFLQWVTLISLPTSFLLPAININTTSTAFRTSKLVAVAAVPAVWDEVTRFRVPQYTGVSTLGQFRRVGVIAFKMDRAVG